MTPYRNPTTMDESDPDPGPVPPPAPVTRCDACGRPLESALPNPVCAGCDRENDNPDMEEVE